jgi:hypothetical protein
VTTSTHHPVGLDQGDAVHTPCGRETQKDAWNLSDNNEPITEEMIIKVEADVTYLRGLVDMGSA